MYAIWNLTNICPWDCSFCCMSTTKEDERGDVLDFESKMTILHILADRDVKIDFSGGDPLFYPEDFLIVEEATKLLPKEKIDVSMTGCDFNAKKLNLIKRVGKVEMSIDNIPWESNPFRPKDFNSSAILVLETITKEGIFCSAVTTLYPHIADKDRLSRLYELLCKKGIAKWNILRFYPVGRGAKFPKLYMDDEKLLKIMEFLDSFNGSTKIAFQHSLRLLRGEYQCHATIGSIGILPDGTVTSCGWALCENSRPLQGFELGKLPKDNFDDILRKARDEMGYGERKTFCRIMHYLKEKGNI